MAEHDLKCWPIWFNDVLSGAKTFEVRRNDRPFCAGDILRLREWAPRDGYTGRECSRRIGYVTDLSDFGIAGFVGMSISPSATSEGEAKASDEVVALEQRVAELERELRGARVALDAAVEGYHEAEAERYALRDAIRVFLAVEYPEGEATEGYADAPAKALRAALAASVSKEEAHNDV